MRKLAGIRDGAMVVHREFALQVRGDVGIARGDVDGNGNVLVRWNGDLIDKLERADRLEAI